MPLPRFEISAPRRIIFQKGIASEAGPMLATLGSRPLLVSGVPLAMHQALVEAWRPAFEAVQEIRVDHEPALPAVFAAASRARELGCDMIIGLGGGSAMDTAKAVAALAANPGDPLEYLEVVGRGLALPNAPLPCAAIPTTSGTGAEATKNAVLLIPDRRVKVSLRHLGMLPAIAILDPLLTIGLPPDVTAATGMDALTQVLEPYVCTRATPYTDALCRDALPRAARALPAVYRDGADAVAREEMMLVSLFGGLALANSGLGAVHGLAAPLGGMLGAPHGALCARLLPAVTAANIRELEKHSDESESLRRYCSIAKWLTGNPDAQARDAVTWLAALAEELHIPRLGEMGLETEHIGSCVEAAQSASSMRPNPIVLPPDELRLILEEAR